MTKSKISTRMKKLFRIAFFLVFSLFLSSISAQSQWVSQGLGWTESSRGVQNISIVNPYVVWVSAYDGSSSATNCTDLSVTSDGGTTWTPRHIDAISTLSIGMVHAVSSTTAWAALYATGMVLGQGIYKTTNGGVSWTRQGSSSMFESSTSFPDVVYFWDSLHGCAIGDPVNNKFEIYTTGDGGDNWIQISPSTLPPSVFGEFDYAGCFSVSGNNIWFGTNKGKMYHSADRGHSWTNSPVAGMAGQYINPAFKDSVNGLCMKIKTSYDTTNLLDNTSDGGATWTSSAYNGQVFNSQISYVPWTAGTYTSTGVDYTYPNRLGFTFTLDNGAHWIVDQVMKGQQVTASSWLSDAIGWLGVFNTGPSDGIYKFNGVLGAPLALTSPFGGEEWNACSVHNITWASDGISNVKIEFSVDGGTNYTTLASSVPAIPGSYAWTIPNTPSVSCRVRISDASNSQVNDSSRYDFAISFAVGEINLPEPAITLTPNPSAGHIRVQSEKLITRITVLNPAGMLLMSEDCNDRVLGIDLSDLASGLYFLVLSSADGSATRKLVINHGQF